MIDAGVVVEMHHWCSYIVIGAHTPTIAEIPLRLVNLANAIIREKDSKRRWSGYGRCREFGSKGWRLLIPWPVKSHPLG